MLRECDSLSCAPIFKFSKVTLEDAESSNFRTQATNVEWRGGMAWRHAGYHRKPRSIQYGLSSTGRCRIQFSSEVRNESTSIASRGKTFSSQVTASVQPDLEGHLLAMLRHRTQTSRALWKPFTDGDCPFEGLSDGGSDLSMIPLPGSSDAQ